MTMPKPMLDGRELSDDELEQLRLQLERFKVVEVSDEMLTLIARQWPELLTRVKPRKSN